MALRDCSFGPMVIPPDGAVKVITDPYADLWHSVEGVDDVLSALNVSAVVLAAGDGTRVGMKHVENIWLKTFSGFSFDPDVYKPLKGKDIESVELYTPEARYVVYAGDGVKTD